MGILNAVSAAKDNAVGYVKGLNEARKAAQDVAKRYGQMYGARATYAKMRQAVASTQPYKPTPVSVSAKVIKKENVAPSDEIDLEL